MILEREKFLDGYGAFGTASTHQAGTDCAPSGSWETWCDCVFPAGDLRDRCKSPPWWAALNAPWTSVGAGARGIPKQDDLIAAAVSTLAPSTVVPTAIPGTNYVVNPGGFVRPVRPGLTKPTVVEDEGIFGLPTTVALVGLGVAGVGVAALLYSRRKKAPALNGYRKRRKARK